MVAAVGAVAVLALAAAGCGGGDGDDDTAGDAVTTEAPAGTSDGGDPEGESSGELHACSLLTPDEIEAQLEASETQPLEGGYEVTSTEISAEAEFSVCSFEWVSEAANGGTPMDRGEFTVELVLAQNLELTRGEFDEEPIPGVGDEAFFIIEVPYAIVDDHAVSITNFQRGEEAQVELLRAAVDRM